MSTQRDALLDLEAIARQAQNQPYPIPTSLWGKQTAMAVYAAGYRKPRTITTAKNLGALPLGSVVLDSTHTTRTYVASANGERYYADCYGEDGVLELPATVLYEPTP